MVARTELEIVWDGPVKGLEFHRISLTKFGPALELLMTAVRRIASQKLQDAIEPTEGGNVKSAANQLDIELAQTREASGGFSTVITFEVSDLPQSLLINQIPELVGRELLESIRSEANGIHRNTAVRNYLRSLPKELTLQDYKLHENGRAIDHVELGSVLLLDEIDEPLPAIIRWRGRVTGVGFEPGKFEVKIEGNDGMQVAALATESQVADALRMRSEDVEALTLTTASGSRLLSIESGSMRVKRPNLDDIFAKWAETFRALA